MLENQWNTFSSCDYLQITTHKNIKRKGYRLQTLVEDITKGVFACEYI